MEIWALILPFLDKFLSKCLEDVSTESPREYLSSHYDEASGTMDPEIVEDAMPQTRRAVRRAHARSRGDVRRNWPRYSYSEIYAKTEERLIQAMNATPEQLAAARAGAAAITDEE